MRHITHRGYHYAIPLPFTFRYLFTHPPSADTPSLALPYALGFRRCFCVSPLVRAPAPRSVSSCRISCTSLGCRLLLLPLLICLSPIYLLYPGPHLHVASLRVPLSQYNSARPLHVRPDLRVPRLYGTTFNALSKSAIMSEMFSMPTDTWDNSEREHDERACGG